jgi:hypothetical protein
MKIRIRSTQKGGFWRCGRHFGFGFQEYDTEDFSDEELGRIAEDPMLVAEPVEFKPEPEPEPEPEEADLEATLSDGRARCQYVGDSGKQCRFAAVEGSDFCHDHQPEPED